MSLLPLHLLLLLQRLLASHFLTATAYRSRWSPGGHHCVLLESTRFQVPSHECPRPALATHQIERPGSKGVLRLDLAVGLLGPHTRCDCGSVGPAAGPATTVHFTADGPEQVTTIVAAVAGCWLLVLVLVAAAGSCCCWCGRCCHRCCCCCCCCSRLMHQNDSAKSVMIFRTKQTHASCMHPSLVA